MKHPKSNKPDLKKATRTRSNSTEKTGKTPKRGNYHYTPKKV